MYVGADSPVKAAAGELPTVESRDVQAHSIDPSQAAGKPSGLPQNQAPLGARERTSAWPRWAWLLNHEGGFLKSAWMAGQTEGQTHQEPPSAAPINLF